MLQLLRRPGACHLHQRHCRQAPCLLSVFLSILLHLLPLLLVLLLPLPLLLLPIIALRWSCSCPSSCSLSWPSVPPFACATCTAPWVLLDLAGEHHHRVASSQRKDLTARPARLLHATRTDWVCSLEFILPHRHAAAKQLQPYATYGWRLIMPCSNSHLSD